MMLRQVGNSVYPTVALTKEGDEYSFSTSSTFKNTVIKFKEGEEFEEETLDGRKIRSVITFDGNKMTHDQKGDKGHIIYRVFTETDLTAVRNNRFLIVISDYISNHFSLSIIYRLWNLTELRSPDTTKLYKKTKS